MRSGLTRAVTGGLLAAGLRGWLAAHPPGGADRWTRVNHRGREVSLLAGPALSVAVAATTSRPAALAGLGAGLVGGYDDAVGIDDGAKGLRGHLTALRRGTLTAGGVKLLAISGLGLLTAARLRPRSAVDVAIGGAIVAGSANLLNLLDLRPGRALKVGVIAAAALGEPGIVGSTLALLPSDVQERAMLGDAGANALGAVLGVAVARRASRRFRLGSLAVLLGLTAASEVVSFTAVIDATPPLRWLDQLGRLP